jgi:hypothetical protein
MYTHVSKCKNDKIKVEKKKRPNGRKILPATHLKGD